MRNERYGTRDLAYSQWHRAESLQHYIGAERAEFADMIDVDFVDYCHWCGTPVMLVETAFDVGEPKSARVLTKLGKMAGVPTYKLLYSYSEGILTGLRVQQTYPWNFDSLHPVSVEEWAQIIDDHHYRSHPCTSQLQFQKSHCHRCRERLSELNGSTDRSADRMPV